MTDYKTFGEMSKEEQLALFVVWQEGRAIERKEDTKWCATNEAHAIFWDDLRYRIAAPKPFFDFSPFSKNIKYVAANENGEVYVFTDEPIKGNDKYWYASKGSERRYIDRALYSPSLTNLFDASIPWQESLVAREGVERC